MGDEAIMKPKAHGTSATPARPAARAPPSSDDGAPRRDARTPGRRCSRTCAGNATRRRRTASATSTATTRSTRATGSARRRFSKTSRPPRGVPRPLVARSGLEIRQNFAELFRSVPALRCAQVRLDGTAQQQRGYRRAGRPRRARLNSTTPTRATRSSPRRRAGPSSSSSRSPSRTAGRRLETTRSTGTTSACSPTARRSRSTARTSATTSPTGKATGTASTSCPWPAGPRRASSRRERA